MFVQNLSASVISRGEAFENNQLERVPLQVDFDALVAKLVIAMNSSVATLTEAMSSNMGAVNSSVKALTEAIILNLKQTQDATQHQSKQDGEKTLASNTLNGKSCIELPVAPPSPWKQKHGWQKGNGSCEIGPQVSERTRSNTKPQSQTRSKEIVRPRSPLRGTDRVNRNETINVPSTTEDDEGATTPKEKRRGSTSPSSNDMFTAPHKKAKATQRPRKKTASNAQGKAIAKEKTLVAGGRGKGAIRSFGRACKPTAKVASNMVNLPPKKPFSFKHYIPLPTRFTGHIAIKLQSNIDCVCIACTRRGHGPKWSW